jgi:hypothetical protein
MAITLRNEDKLRSPSNAGPSLSVLEEGEEIVCTVGNDGDCAMSARRILGGQYLPRVGLFAH